MSSVFFRVVQSAQTHPWIKVTISCKKTWNLLFSTCLLCLFNRCLLVPNSRRKPREWSRHTSTSGHAFAPQAPSDCLHAHIWPRLWIPQLSSGLTRHSWMTSLGGWTSNSVTQLCNPGQWNIFRNTKFFWPACGCKMSAVTHTQREREKHPLFVTPPSNRVWPT